jgi:hypothetical protein
MVACTFTLGDGGVWGTEAEFRTVRPKHFMARTKQAARKSIGGKPPRMQLATKVSSPCSLRAPPTHLFPTCPCLRRIRAEWGHGVRWGVLWGRLGRHAMGMLCCVLHARPVVCMCACVHVCMCACLHVCIRAEWGLWCVLGVQWGRSPGHAVLCCAAAMLKRPL